MRELNGELQPVEALLEHEQIGRALLLRAHALELLYLRRVVVVRPVRRVGAP